MYHQAQGMTNYAPLQKDSAIKNGVGLCDLTPLVFNSRLREALALTVKFDAQQPSVDLGLLVAIIFAPKGNDLTGIGDRFDGQAK